ncbi:von Willebrand factor A domain-containing protein 8 [Phytophthora fragariae]|uniref:von Willebrand factor A domain-containing protein 8 n=1 Tax=Phytophthora fragariae TaxID=53985 RepID=A0A6A3FPQ9_9STRA|nr:von Willebrand factor A domain-containing protein 8 [Phytophthora fragariae]KAE8948054.1 von Willebrand factor A domain-containing protein 8 [Phytophthora fragariae]KAE9019551.1 von Willebrand factor A domain-containing protein 8 [Phytophthora fragariae]KAE9120890.1 von Willebrand factor A domain-containing protein 8 [Phytophthora fragariae]KAE9138432.1 von Willebrand factor A domain-containing protein 8 [Phytophthora fragariae]
MLRTLGRQRRGWRLAAERRSVFAMRGTSSAAGPSGQKPSMVEIGGVKANVGIAKSIELVPRGYMTELQQGRPMSQELLGHLRWMLQKDLLKQDMFLIGPPGSFRRLLSMRFCELLNKEVEYIAISQDTTESDLKQRREIVDGAAIFTDQAPVRAALNGRVLVIDGLEKAERNVLPTLNNLLENREMMLDDGRFLMKAESYDALVDQGYSAEDLKAQNLVRVHPDFRVIALGLPVPPYPGRTLDPPLRSRFQARNVKPSSPGSQLEELVVVAPSVPLPTLEKLVGIREAVNTIEATYDIGTSTGPRMPHFDYLSLAHCAKVLEKFPDSSVASTVQRAFPVKTDVLGVKTESNSKALDRIVAKFTDGIRSKTYLLDSVVKTSAEDVEATVKFRTPGARDNAELVLHNVPCGTTRIQKNARSGFVETDTHSKMLAEMIQDHAVGSDLCVLGAKGSGKSALVGLFAHRMGYATELFSLFKDMTARDLLQRRSTDSHGNTRWEDSPLIHAARNGHLAVLDGVHRLGSDSLGVLQRLIQDREIDLADGSKLVSQTTYDSIVADASKTRDASALSRVSAIHPSFRIIAIAEADPATLTGTAATPGKGSTAAWLSSDSISMFSFHHLPMISSEQSEKIVRSLYPGLPEETTSILLSFSEKLQNAKETSANADYRALSLSTRQLLRVCRRLNAFPEHSLRDLRPLLHDTLLTQFLSSTCSRLVDTLLDECNAPAIMSSVDTLTEADTIREEEGRLCIGDTSYPIQTPTNPELVPQPHYFDIPKHTQCMKAMLQDVVAGQKHMLLIGNQGVGKNKLADRLLQLLQQEREYIQLHRDTTVQTLTLVPTLIDGMIEWEDSPLVRAAKTGRTLIVDEADKAPLEVVCVLKGLIEDGEMLLGNGKRLIDPTKVAIEEWHDEEDIIELHPNFRMWVLANRPGFPFLGNNFFREIGDIFASHAIDNPDEESELSLLTAYAPNVPVDILRRLCRAFAELRELVENGTITYPYSTREAVAVAKHLEQFPNDGVASVLENVLAFDAYDRNMRTQLSEIFLRHGIPLSATGETLVLKMNIAETRDLPDLVPTESWRWDPDQSAKFSAAIKKPQQQLHHSTLNRRQIWLDPSTARSFALQHHRLHEFTEQLSSFQVPLKGNRKQQAHAMTVFPDNSVHVLTRRPMCVHSFSDFDGSERVHSILELESEYMQWEPHPVLVNLPDKNEIAVFIPSTGLTIFLNPLGNSDGRADCLTLPDGALDGRLHVDASMLQGKKRSKQNPLTKWFGGGDCGGWRAEADRLNAGLVLRYLQGGSLLQVLDLNSNNFSSLDLAKLSASMRAPLAELLSVQPIGKREWLLRTTDETVVYKLSHETQKNDFSLSVATIDCRTGIRSSAIDSRHSVFPGRLQDQGDMGSATFMVHPQAFLQVLDGDNSDLTIRSSLREDAHRREVQQAWQSDSFILNAVQSDSGDLVDMEVTYPETQSTKSVVVGSSPPTGNKSDDSRFFSLSTERSYIPRVVDVASVHNGKHTLTLQEDGAIRVWQLDQAELDREAELWKSMYGSVDEFTSTGGFELKLDGSRVGGPSTPKTGLDAPKYGKDDPNNDPHVGGNTWAGGTGGSDTAGLGGRGGPYRLDKGHPVHQVSQEKKDEVSAEARAKAQAMAQEALTDKLREIDMSDREWETYQFYFKRVERESAQLRAVLANLEAVAQERNWLRHQSSGELDDGKLVDGVAGERLVFKRRGASDSSFQAPAGHQQDQEPKQMLFVVDVSGSMYRFNSQDSRLERMLETSLMIMESFAGFERELDYCIMGHSGDSPEIPFVEFGAPPKDRKERLRVLQKMVAHTQYCRSGDHTVEAVERGVQRVAALEGDDRFVFVVSDANLERYGIEPRYLGRKLVSEPGVQAHALFIASFADEADRIRRELPAGRGHVCLDTSDLPRMFKQIFTSAFGQT